LAQLQLAAPLAMALFALPATHMVIGGDRAGLAKLLTASALIALGAAAWYLRHTRITTPGWFSGNGAWWSQAALRRFMAVAGSMFLSGLFSSWVLLAVRARVLNQEGLETGGLFDAAWALSMNQAGLMLASLQTYYLPALARTTDLGQRAAHITRVLMVTSGGAAVLITLLIVVKPLALEVLYSPAFVGATRFLRWTLIGDYLKITSWILSIPLLASANMRVFLAADLSAYGAFAGAAYVLTRWFGAAESASIAFVVMYLVHLAFCGGWLWSRREFRPGAPLLLSWCAGLAAILLASGVTWKIAGEPL
jgi:hypothetical protein